MSKTTQTIKGTRELGELLGTSHVAVSKWIKRPEWKFGPGPWKVSQLPAIQKWRELNLAPANVATPESTDVSQLPPLKKAKLKIDIERGKLLEHANKLNASEYHKVADCDARHLEQITDARRRLLAVADGLPFEADVKALVKNRILQALQALAT